jgi:hypothetical protein
MKVVEALGQKVGAWAAPQLSVRCAAWLEQAELAIWLATGDS